MNDMRPVKQLAQPRLGPRGTAGNQGGVGLLDIYLIDPDLKRRAAICHDLVGKGFFVQPFESIAELIPRFPKTGIILAADQDSLVVETLNLVSALRRSIPVVAYSEEVDVRRIVQAIHAGSINYLSWPDDQSHFSDVIISISASFLTRDPRSANSPDAGSRANGQVPQAHPAAKGIMLRTSHADGAAVSETEGLDAARAALAKLTRRESEILALVIEGLPSRDIARQFGISHRTVEIHRSNILRKLDVRNSVEAARIALEGGLSIDQESA